MAKPGDVLEIPELGLRMLVLHTGEETGGELLDIEASGRPRGFLAQAHVHEHSVEHHTVIDGVLAIGLGGKEHVLHVGESMEIPAGAPHTQRPAPRARGRSASGCGRPESTWSSLSAWPSSRARAS